MSDDLQIYPDSERGHIAFRQVDERGDRRDITAVDEGERLHIGGGWLRLTPNQARRVADSLTWWADRHPAEVIELPDGQAELPIGDAS